MRYKKHIRHERREGFVKEAVEHIEEPKKVPHSNLTYGKMPSNKLKNNERR